jgi:hypothetical protein
MTANPDIADIDVNPLVAAAARICWTGMAPQLLTRTSWRT